MIHYPVFSVHCSLCVYALSLSLHRRWTLIGLDLLRPRWVVNCAREEVTVPHRIAPPMPSPLRLSGVGVAHCFFFLPVYLPFFSWEGTVYMYMMESLKPLPNLVPSAPTCNSASKEKFHHFSMVSTDKRGRRVVFFLFFYCLKSLVIPSFKLAHRRRGLCSILFNFLFLRPSTKPKSSSIISLSTNFFTTWPFFFVSF